MVEFADEGHKVIGVISYSLAAVLGIVAANYYESWQPNATAQIVGGVVALAIPIWVMKENSGVMGPVRMWFAVAGLTMLIRGLIGANGIAPQTGLPSQFSVITQ
jgi:hypothetical protein